MYRKLNKWISIITFQIESKSFRQKELSFQESYGHFLAFSQAFSNLPWVALAHAEEQ